MINNKKFVKFDKKNHDRDCFDCGEEELNNFIKNLSSQQMKKNLNQTRVLQGVLKESGKFEIIAYYTFAPGCIDPIELPDQSRKNLPKKQKVPVFLVGRLAVDKRYQSQKEGEGALVNLLNHLVKVNDDMPAYAVVVDPLNDSAADFYKKYGFKPLVCLSGKKRFFLPINTIKQLL